MWSRKARRRRTVSDVSAQPLERLCVQTSVWLSLRRDCAAWNLIEVIILIKDSEGHWLQGCGLSNERARCTSDNTVVPAEGTKDTGDAFPDRLIGTRSFDAISSLGLGGTFATGMGSLTGSTSEQGWKIFFTVRRFW